MFITVHILSLFYCLSSIGVLPFPHIAALTERFPGQNARIVGTLASGHNLHFSGMLRAL